MGNHRGNASEMKAFRNLVGPTCYRRRNAVKDTIRDWAIIPLAGHHEFTPSEVIWARDEICTSYKAVWKIVVRNGWPM